MRNLPGWVIGALGVGVVAGAFFLGGRLAASDLTPTATIASSTAPGYVVECEPGQRAVIRQPATANSGAATVACVGSVGPRSVPVSYRPAATYQTAGTRSGAVRTSAPTTRVSRNRSTKRSVAIIAGSTAAGAVIGGVAKGKRGAVVGGLVGGVAATIWDQATRRKIN